MVADRTVSWAGGVGYGSHTETAVLKPATTWYLAEGATGGGFDLYYLLQNSNEGEVQVESDVPASVRAAAAGEDLQRGRARAA